jgi:hypothetical protein
MYRTVSLRVPVTEDVTVMSEEVILTKIFLDISVLDGLIAGPTTIGGRFTSSSSLTRRSVLGSSSGVLRRGGGDHRARDL